MKQQILEAEIDRLRAALGRIEEIADTARYLENCYRLFTRPNEKALEAGADHMLWEYAHASTAIMDIAAAALRAEASDAKDA